MCNLYYDRLQSDDHMIIIIELMQDFKESLAFVFDLVYYYIQAH